MIPAMMPSHRPATTRTVYQWIGVGDSQLATQVVPVGDQEHDEDCEQQVADQRDDDEERLHLAGDLARPSGSGRRTGSSTTYGQSPSGTDGNSTVSSPLATCSSSHMKPPYTGA